MKIALIHHPLGHRSFSENLKVVDEEFCLAPPILLAYVAAILEKAGHKVIIVDANALKLTKEKTLNILRKFSPEIIGFRADSYWFHRVVEWANYFKSVINVRVIVGGINIDLYPKESLSYSCFDYGIVGESIETLPKLLSILEKGESVDNIEGIVYRDKNTIRFNSPSQRLIPFDDYPFPARHLLPNHLYHSFTSQRKNYTIMLTTTGCPYKCTFCAISKLPYRERSPKNVVGEIEECYKLYSIREIEFFDATFFINKRRSLEICEEILNRGIKIEWSCRSRVDVVDEDILKKSAEAGCKRIYYGIESVSSEVLRNIHKDIDKRQIIHAIDLTHKYGIDALGFFMVGNSNDTKETVLATIDFAKRLKLDFIQVCRAIAKPNSRLNDLLIEKYGIDYWKEYILGKRDMKRLPTLCSTLSEDELEKYARKFYKDFYFRPSYIVRRIRKLKSISEFVRYTKTALKWLFCNYTD
jgi:radical SAM superfamily enzyme YgiQ (UPF0313 family)